LNGNPLGKNYGIRRIARVYPLWVLFLIITIVRSQTTNSGGFYRAVQASKEQKTIFDEFTLILLSLTFLLFTSSALWNTVIPGGWSIQAEVAHYLLFPVMRNRSLNFLFGVASIVNIATLILIHLRSRIDVSSRLAIEIIDSWLRLGLYSTFGFFIIGITSFHFFNNCTIWYFTRWTNCRIL
jgi:peptidoglycan/LPS O-acetylase OafA/YrhL